MAKNGIKEYVRLAIIEDERLIKVKKLELNRQDDLLKKIKMQIKHHMDSHHHAKLERDRVSREYLKISTDLIKIDERLMTNKQRLSELQSKVEFPERVQNKIDILTTIKERYGPTSGYVADKVFGVNNQSTRGKVNGHVRTLKKLISFENRRVYGTVHLQQAESAEAALKLHYPGLFPETENIIKQPDPQEKSDAELKKEKFQELISIVKRMVDVLEKLNKEW